MKRLCIELIGMPSSGKSFYFNKIRSSLKKENLISNNFNYLNKFEKFFFLILFIFKYFKYSIKVLNIFTKSNFSLSKTRSHFYWFINESSLRMYYELTKKRTINSEGFAYRTVYYINALNYRSEKKEVKNFINIMPKTNFLINVISKKKINLARNKKRKKGFKYTQNELKFYSKNNQIIGQICKEIKKKSIVLQISKKSEKKDLKKIIDRIKKELIVT